MHAVKNHCTMRTVTGSMLVGWCSLVVVLGLGAGSCRPVAPPSMVTQAPAPSSEDDVAPCEAAELDDDLSSRRLRAVVELLDAPTRDAVVAFDRDVATEEMKLRWPLDEQVAILGGWFRGGTSATICRVVEQSETQVIGVIGFHGPEGDARFQWLEVDLDPDQDGRVVQFQGVHATQAALRAKRPIGVPLVTRSKGGEPLADEADARRALVETNLTRSIHPDGRRQPRSLGERMAQLRVPGVSIAVIHRGRIDWARGYGVLQAGTTDPVDRATMFQAASMSKPVAVLAALRLVEAEALDLDADVNEYLKTWTVPANEFTERRPVTIRDIASHCAGFTVHGFGGYAEGEPVPSVPQLLDGSSSANNDPIRVDKPPGEGFRYSGGGTTVLQQLLVDVTGKPFEQIIAREVLQTVGMPRSTVEQPLPDRFHANAAVGHRGDGQIVEGRWHTYPEMAAAGLWTRPLDLAELLIDVHRAFNDAGGRLVSTKTIRDALGRQCPGMAGLPGSMAGYVGLGFMVAPRTGDLRFGHGGANEGFRGQMLMDARRGSGVVVMTNSDTGGQLTDEVINAVAHVYGWPAHEHREVALASLDTAAFDRVAGTYTFPPGGPIQVEQVRFVRDGGVVRAEFDDQIVSEVFPTGERSYLLFEPFLVRIEFGASDDEAWVEFDGPGGLRALRAEPAAPTP